MHIIGIAIRHDDKLLHVLGNDVGWGNGYIGVPPIHPWFERPYMDINCDVDGGLTYGEHRIKYKTTPDIWWVGFDTAHSWNNPYEHDERYVWEQIKQLKAQALETWENYRRGYL